MYPVHADTAAWRHVHAHEGWLTLCVRTYGSVTVCVRTTDNSTSCKPTHCRYWVCHLLVQQLLHEITFRNITSIANMLVDVTAYIASEWALSLLSCSIKNFSCTIRIVTPSFSRWPEAWLTATAPHTHSWTKKPNPQKLVMTCSHTTHKNLQLHLMENVARTQGFI